MTFEEIRGMIPESLGGQLKPADKELFEAEMTKSAELRVEVEQLRFLWEGLGEVPEEEPSAAMRARFYQRLNALSRGSIGVAESRPAWWKVGLWQQAAIGMAVFLLGLYVGRANMGERATVGEVAQ